MIDFKRFGMVLAALSLLTLVGFKAAAEEFDVYILAGQSNMDGRGEVEELEKAHPQLSVPNRAIPTWYANSAGEGYSTGWVPLAPGLSIPPRFTRKDDASLPSHTFGVEVSFGPAMAEQADGRRVAIIKVSRGGTSLARDWDPELPNEDALYKLLIHTVQTALAELADNGDTGHLRGMVWHQGESDRNSTVYADRLAEFIQHIRKDLDQPALPLVIGEVFDNGSRDIVRAQQHLAAEKIDHAVCVPCEGLNAPDNTHFDAESLVTFGQRMARAMQALQSEAE